MTIRDRMIDLNGVDNVEITIGVLNDILWINVDGKCMMRIQAIKECITIELDGNTYHVNPKKEP